jgi:hypothetical protein
MQTNYKVYMESLILGHIAETSLRQFDSYAAEAKIPFATAVKRGTKEDKQCLPIDNAKLFLGVAIRDDICTEGVYPTGKAVSVMIKGRVAVIVSEAVKAGDKAYIHNDGKFSKTPTSGHEIGIFSSTQALKDNLVILEIK